MLVGDLDLDYEALELTSDRSAQLIAYSAAPGSTSHDALSLLASWVADPAIDGSPSGATRMPPG